MWKVPSSMGDLLVRNSVGLDPHRISLLYQDPRIQPSFFRTHTREHEERSVGIFFLGEGEGYKLKMAGNKFKMYVNCFPARPIFDFFSTVAKARRRSCLMGCTRYTVNTKLDNPGLGRGLLLPSNFENA
jgi:hypothetical protein